MMSFFRGLFARRRRLLLFILVVAFGIRLLGCFGQGLPWSYYPDERHSVKQAMRLGAQRSLDPGWFNKPALGYYVLLVEYGAYYAAGRATGIFDGPEDFGASFFASQEEFLLIGRISNTLFAVATLWIVFLIGRRVGNRRTGLLAALFLALSVGHIDGSQEVKMDVPAAFWSAAALLAMVKMVQLGRTRDYLWAGLLGGLGMATKYYPACLALVFIVAHLVRTGRARELAGRTWLSARAWGGGFAFLGGFFIGSPYNLLSWQWFDERLRDQFVFMWKRISSILPDLGTPQFMALPPESTEAPANQLIGASTPIYESLLHNLVVLFGPQGAGPVVFVLMLVGVGYICRRRTALRWLLLAGFLIPLLFLSFANQLSSEPRHLMILLTPLAVLAAFGVQAIGHLVGGMRRLRASVRERRSLVFGCLLVLAPLPYFPVWLVVEHAHRQLAPDPRHQAQTYIDEKLPAGATIINDNQRVFIADSKLRMQWAIDTIQDEIDRINARLEAMKDASRFERDALRRRAGTLATRRLEWEFRVRGSSRVKRPTFDVISLHHEWMNEDLWKRDGAGSFYNDLWPRSPFGWSVTRGIAKFKARARAEGVPEAEMGAQVTPVKILLHVRDEVDTALNEEIRAQLVSEGVDVKSPAGKRLITERLTELYASLGGNYPHSPPPPVELWRHATPISARWLTQDANGRPRPAEWFVSSKKSYDNYMTPHKRANFPDWALFYDDLKGHYDSWIFGQGDPDDERVIRLWDLRERVMSPKVVVMPGE